MLGFALPEIGREAPATVCAPLVVSLPWRVAARCPIVDPDLAPRRSAIPVLVAAMVLTARRLLPSSSRPRPLPRRASPGRPGSRCGQREAPHRCCPSLERRCGREQRQRLLGDGSPPKPCAACAA